MILSTILLLLFAVFIFRGHDWFVYHVKDSIEMTDENRDYGVYSITVSERDTFSQDFYGKELKLQRVALRFDNPSRKTAKGIVLCQIFKDDQLLGESSAELSNIVDQERNDFVFEDGIKLKSQELYTMCVSFRNVSDAEGLAVRVHGDKGELFGDLKQNGRQADGRMRAVFYYRDIVYADIAITIVCLFLLAVFLIWYLLKKRTVGECSLRITASRYVFVVLFLTYLAFMALRSTSYNMYHQYATSLVCGYVLRICALLALTSVLFLCDYSTRDTLIACVTCAFVSLVVFCIRKTDMELIYSVPLLFAAKHVEWKEVVKIGLFGNAVSGILVVLAYVTGIFQTMNICRDDGTFRHSFGFSHPNKVGLLLTCMIISYILIRYERLKIIECVMMLLVAVFTWVSPNCKTATFVILIILFLVAFMKTGEHLLGKSLLKCPLFRILSVSFCPILAAGTIGMGYCFDASSSFQNLIDLKLFSGRLSWTYSYFQRYNVTLFGQSIDHMNAADPLDSFYVRILIHMGIFMLFAYVGMLVFMTWRALKQEKEAEFIALIAIIIYSVWEYHFMKLSYNMMMFWFVKEIYAFLDEKKYLRYRIKKRMHQPEG